MPISQRVTAPMRATVSSVTPTVVSEAIRTPGMKASAPQTSTTCHATPVRSAAMAPSNPASTRNAGRARASPAATTKATPTAGASESTDEVRSDPGRDQDRDHRRNQAQQTIPDVTARRHPN